MATALTILAGVVVIGLVIRSLMDQTRRDPHAARATAADDGAMPFMYSSGDASGSGGSDCSPDSGSADAGCSDGGGGGDGGGGSD